MFVYSGCRFYILRLFLIYFLNFTIKGERCMILFTVINCGGIRLKYVDYFKYIIKINKRCIIFHIFILYISYVMNILCGEQGSHIPKRVPRPFGLKKISCLLRAQKSSTLLKSYSPHLYGGRGGSILCFLFFNEILTIVFIIFINRWFQSF